MFKLISLKKSWIIIVLTIITIFNFSFVIAFAGDKEKSKLESKLEQQESDLKDDIGNKFIPKDDTIIDDTADTIANAEYKDFNINEKTNSITDFIKTVIIKSRTTVIIVYALVVAILSLYIATIGSRSLNKRRHGLILLIGNTLLFLVYINIPLIIIYFSAVKDNIASISLLERIMSLINFLQENSFVVSILLAYLGVNKLIVSKNDLPTRLQGKYLLKAAAIMLVILNVVPIAINFII